MSEFSVIEKYFKPLTQGRAETLALKDDAAILSVSFGHELVVSTDSLNAGTHFLANEKPEFIAHKALRTNLSDMAAMGAKPFCYQMAITFPKKPSEKWLKEFTGALLKDQKEFGVFCSGGDTTVTKGALSITITVLGFVPRGKAVKRSGAKPGDALVITGPVGDAFIGLCVLQKKIKSPAKKSVMAYRKPMPRTALAEIVRTHANAAIDISDGLIADVGHICTTSKCAARIDLPKIKFSTEAQKLLAQGKIKPADLLTGGDDYELALAIPQKKLAAALRKLKQKGLKPQVIGHFEKGRPMVRVFNKDREIFINKAGWQHF